MLGSAMDADDAVQETMVRAWRSLDRFDGRASLRTWLHRIATNVCLDTLAQSKVRSRPMEEGPAGTVEDALVAKHRSHWLEPIPDALVVPGDADPAERAILKQSTRLAFVAALQHLPPKQRAVLLLSDVLGWSAAEIGECLTLSIAAVNSALQRARATLAGRSSNPPKQLDERQQELLKRYVAAFESYDVNQLAGLLRDDATFSMPPYDLWFRGREPVQQWLLGRGAACRGSRLIPTGTASGCPAFGQYKPLDDGGYAPWCLVVLELSEDVGEEPTITSWNSFLDTEALFPLFGLPSSLGPLVPHNET